MNKVNIVLFIILFERFGSMSEKTSSIDFIECFTGIAVSFLSDFHFYLSLIFMASQIS